MKKKAEYISIAKRVSCIHLLGKYAFSPSGLRGRVRCLVVHVPFSRRIRPRWHDLECGASIIVSLDGIITDPKEVAHTMRERGLEL